MKYLARKIDEFAIRFSKPTLALLLMVQISIPGAALCLKADGKASVENYSNGACAESFKNINRECSTEDSPNTENYTRESHCGQCLDIPVSERVMGKNVLSQNDLDSEVGMHIFAAYVLPVSPYPQTSHKAAVTEVPPNISASSVFIQTTILIC